MAKRKTRVERSVPRPAPLPPVAYAVLPLRLFLGVTFLYAGLQKIADPGFLHPGASTYVGIQLQAFAGHSPIGFLLEWFALPVPQLAGIAVITAELTIGLSVLLGLFTRSAAAAGALLSFVLFLTASWTIQPYFLGSDSIYTVAWITLVLAGDQGVLVAGQYLFRQLGFESRPIRRRSVNDPARRRLLLQLGGAAVALVWVLAVIPRTRQTARAVASPSSRPAESPSGSAGATPSASRSAAASPTGTKIGSLSDLKAQGSVTFQDPASGDPALAVQLSAGNVVAFDAVCTHAGCQVGYDTSSRLITCPCHGAEFDPAHAAAVVAGPAPTPLGSIKVRVASDGSIYTA